MWFDRFQQSLRPIAKAGYRFLDARFRRLGFKLVRVERPTRTFDEFFQHIKTLGFAPSTIVDVGAASGTLSLHTAFPHAKFVLIEPLHEFYEPLTRLATRYECELHFVAAGARPGEVQIAVSPDLYGSEIACTVARDTRTVRMVTVDQILQGNPYLQPPILLKIDVQGYELEVLQGTDRHLHSCEVIMIEASTYKVSESPPDFYGIVDYMKKHGWSVYDIVDGIYRPYDNCLGQIDLVFVRDDGPFRTYAGWA
jgi:FkbM family methyltransferase